MASDNSLSDLHNIRASLLATLDQGKQPSTHIDRAIAAASSSNRPCHFRRLPLELREQIHELALFPQPQEQRLLPYTQDYPGLAGTTATDHHGCEVSTYNTELYRPPPLLQVSRQIRGEASEIFYSKVIFWKHSAYWSAQCDITLLQKVLSSLSAEDREMVKNVRLERIDYLRNTPWPFNDSDARMIVSASGVEGLGDVRRLLEIPLKDEDAEGGWCYEKFQDLEQ